MSTRWNPAMFRDRDVAPPTTRAPLSMKAPTPKLTTATPRIGLLGYFGSGNLGNEATLEAVLDCLDAHGLRDDCVCLCPFAEAARTQHAIAARAIRPLPLPHASFSKRLRRRIGEPIMAARALKGLDVLLIPGTGILDDFGERPQGMPLTLLVTCVTARLMGVRIGFVSIGAGPIRNRLSRFLMTQAVRVAHHRSFRDAASRDFVEGLGIDVSRDVVTPDLVFGLQRTAQLAVNDNRQPANDVPVVVLGVMNYLGWTGRPDEGEATYQAYLEKLVVIGRSIVARGIRLRLVIGEDTDRRAVNDIANRLRSRGDFDADLLAISDAQTLSALVAEMTDCEAVVATRFHNIVAGVLAGRAMVSIGYAPKNDVVMGQAGLSDRCFRITDFSTEDVLAALDGVMSERAALARGVETARARLAADLKTHIAELAPLLKYRRRRWRGWLSFSKFFGATNISNKRR